MTDLLQVGIGGLAAGAVYVLMALGITMIFSTTGILNFAQGDVLMVGAFVTYTGLTLWHLPIILTLVLVVAVTALLGLVIEKTSTLALAANPDSISWLLSTFGASLVIEQVIGIIWGTSDRSVPAVAGERVINIAGAHVAAQELLVILIAFLATFGLQAFLSRTIVGQGITAVAYNSQHAALMGIPVRKVISLSFMVGGALAGFAGWLVGPLLFAQASAGSIIVLEGFIAAIIGGMGSYYGALAGGLALGLSEALLAWQVAPWAQQGCGYLFLILVLLLRPRGIFAARALRQA